MCINFGNVQFHNDTHTIAMHNNFQMTNSFQKQTVQKILKVVCAVV